MKTYWGRSYQVKKWQQMDFQSNSGNLGSTSRGRGRSRLTDETRALGEAGWSTLNIGQRAGEDRERPLMCTGLVMAVINRLKTAQRNLQIFSLILHDQLYSTKVNLL